MLAHSLSGTVYANGVPMPGATVSLFVTADGSPAGSMSTNDAGAYALEVADGVYFLIVDPPAGAAGYVPARVNDLVIAGEARVQNVALVTQSSLSGVVRLPDGAPVGGVRITLVEEAGGDEIGPILADASGAYGFAVPPGTYHFNLDGGAESYPGRPGNFVYQNAQQGTVVTGSTIQDIVLPFAFLRGRTIDSDGVPVGDVELEHPWTGGTRADGSTCSAVNSGSARSGADGSYVLALCDGFAYDLIAIAPPGAGVSSHIFHSITLSGDTQLDLVLPDGEPLSGVVRFPNGDPVAGVRIAVYEQESDSRFAQMHTNAEGAYAFTIQPGRYRYYLDRGSETYAGAPLQFVFSGYRDTIVAGPTVRDIVLPFAFLRGRTTDEEGQPVGGVWLHHLYTGGDRPDGSSCVVVNYYQSIVSNPDGTYAMALCDGFSYDITAVPPEGSLLASTVFDGVAVAGNANRDFVLRLPALRGTVKLPDGAPVGGVRVWVTDDVSGRSYGPTYADSEGRYGFAVPDGAYRFSLDGGRETYLGKPLGFTYSEAVSTIVAGTTIRDVVLPFAFLSGRTTDSNGVPVGGVELTHPSTSGTLPDGSTCTVVNYYGSAVTAADGSYRMALCDGLDYDLTAAPPAATGFSPSTILAVNVAGPTGLNIALQLPDTTPPVIVSGPYATSVGTGTATIVWQTDEPARGSADRGTDSVEETEERTQHAVLMEGLTAATTYTVTVTARDRAGNGPATASVAFTTASLPDTAPPLILSGPTVSGLTHESALVEWETNEPATTEVRGDLAVTLPGLRSLHRVELAGLAASTRYAVTVVSADVAGNGPATRETTFTTRPALDVTPPVITKGPWAVDVTSTAATIQWETDEPADSGVSYNDGTAHGVINDDAVTQQHAVRATGLEPGTRYFVTVSSRDSFGNGPTLSGVLTVSTLTTGDTEAPVFVETPGACNVNHQLIHLCFRTDEPASVVVRYGTSPDSLDHVEARSQLVRQHSLPLNGLAASTTYFMLVQVADAAGNERSAEILEVTTRSPGAQATLAFVTPPTVTYESESRAVIQWETDRPTTGLVEYGTTGFSQQARSSGLRLRHGVVLTNLTPGSVYEYRVLATDVDGARVEAGSWMRAVAGRTSLSTGAEVVTTATSPDTTPPVFTTTPTVRSVTGTTAVVVWTTSETADTRVRFGPAQPLESSTGDIEFSREHVVELTKLEPSSSYSFQVFSVDPSGNEAASAVHSFSTASGITPSGVPGARCGPGSVVLGVTGASADEDYRWYAQPEGGAPIQNGGGSFTTPPLTDSTTFYATIYSPSEGWETDRIAIAATVQPVPAAPTAGNGGVVGEGGTVNLTASTVAGADYTWTGPNGFASTLQNPTIPNATTAASGTYSVTATVNGCTSSPGTTTVVVSALWPLSITKAGAGQGTVISNPAGISCGGACSASFGQNDVVVLTALAESGSIFAGWSGEDCSGTGSCTVTMTQARNVTAAFDADPDIPRSLTVTVVGSGSVSSAPTGVSCPGTCENTFPGLSGVTLTAEPAHGSRFAGWAGGGCSGTGTCTVTMDAAKTVSATFLPATPVRFYTLTPCRVVDTRNPAGPFGGPALAADSTRAFPLGGACNVPADAAAVSLNVTVADATAPGSLTIYPGTGPIPGTNTITFVPGKNRANNVTMGLVGGNLTVVDYQATGTVNLIVDVNGYYR
ncbi:MAG: Ig-like domain-containing protein [Thermoanaerobaculia bacterium]